MNKILKELKEFILTVKKVQAKSPFGKNLDVIVVPDNFAQIREIMELDKDLVFLTAELAEKEDYKIYLVTQTTFKNLDVPWTAIWNVSTEKEVAHV